MAAMLRTLGMGGWLIMSAISVALAQEAGPSRSIAQGVTLAAAEAPAAPVPYAWRGREAEIEAFLRTAPIMHVTDIPVGITKPRRAFFAPGGPAASMAWKPLTPGVLHGKMESYRSEIAAYLLSRHLGLDMVPPVVERTLKGARGAAVYWIDGVRPWDPSSPPRISGPNWSRQTSRMLMFDQLIGNIDRNQGNLLYDDRGHLYLIDHSRAFVTDSGLGRLKPPQQFDRALWARMEALTRSELDAVLAPWVDHVQIGALLSRRDLMRRHIERQVREQGEHTVFLPHAPPLTDAALR